jgi:hypothetical protein
MTILGRRILAGLTALAALLTPVRGLPHFVCRCPDGRLKPFCLSFFSTQRSACCCGRACCSGTPGRCCCCACPGCGGRHGVAGADESPSAGGCLLGTPGCVKTLTGPELLALASGRQTAGDDLPPPAGLSAPADLGADLSRAPGCDLAPARAPPADLVTLLRRLVI